MKFYSTIVALLLSALLAGSSGAYAQKSSGGKGTGRGEGGGRGEGRGKGSGGEKPERGVEQTVVTTPTVNVTLGTRAGNISVHGWDRQEVHAVSKESDAKLELRKTCNPARDTEPAPQFEVVISNKPEEDPDYEESDSDHDITLDVPRGATLFLKTQDGDIAVG